MGKITIDYRKSDVKQNYNKNYTDVQILEIVKDLLKSKREGKRPESLVPYAKQIEENLNSASGTQAVTLCECLDIAKSDFLDELYERISDLNTLTLILQNFYFTFSGADIRFPYQNGYLVVRAENEKEAFRKFRFRYPDPYLNCLCCASWYSQEKWDEIDVDMGTCHEIIE